MTVIEELADVIHKLHGVKATHVESVSVHETFQGKTVWDGIVEVFHLEGHPKTDTAYAWLHDTGDPAKPHQHVTVLRIHPALSPLAAVQAFIVQEVRNAQTAQTEAE
jgi:hypothetical protein